jgi:signal peptidase I
MRKPENARTTLACGLAGDVVRRFGGVRLRVFGTSMVPSILPGDLISVQRADLSEISPGEIVLYSRDERLFAHRVVARAGGHHDSRLITRGDRLSYTDPPVSSLELLGRVTSIQCGDGRGCRPVRPAARVRRWAQMAARVLQISDRATSVYLRLSRYWRCFLCGRAACRA